MKPTSLLQALLRKNAATQTQMNAVGTPQQQELGHSPTQGQFAKLLGGANKPVLPPAPVKPAAPAPALAKTLPMPAKPMPAITAPAPTNPATGK